MLQRQRSWSKALMIFFFFSSGLSTCWHNKQTFTKTQIITLAFVNATKELSHPQEAENLFGNLNSFFFFLHNHEASRQTVSVSVFPPQNTSVQIKQTEWKQFLKFVPWWTSILFSHWICILFIDFYDQTKNKQTLKSNILFLISKWNKSWTINKTIPN